MYGMMQIARRHPRLFAAIFHLRNIPTGDDHDD